MSRLRKNIFIEPHFSPQLNEGPADKFTTVIERSLRWH